MAEYLRTVRRQPLDARRGGVPARA